MVRSFRLNARGWERVRDVSERRVFRQTVSQEPDSELSRRLVDSKHQRTILPPRGGQGGHRRDAPRVRVSPVARAVARLERKAKASIEVPPEFAGALFPKRTLRAGF